MPRQKTARLTGAEHLCHSEWTWEAGVTLDSWGIDEGDDDPAARRLELWVTIQRYQRKP